MPLPRCSLVCNWVVPEFQHLSVLHMLAKLKQFNFPTKVAIVVLVFQCALIIRAQFDPARYFCWGMFHSVSTYQIEAELNGKALSPQEIKARYGRPQRGVEARSIQHLKDVIAQRESKASQPAHVRMLYSVNGKADEEWTWTN